MDLRVRVPVMGWDQQNPISWIAIKLFSELLTWFTSAINPVNDSYLIYSKEADLSHMSNSHFPKTMYDNR